jgi:hypothetical protein
MKLLFGISFILLFTGCNQKVGGNCTYESFNEQVGISEIKMNGEDIEFVTLSGGDASSVFSYKLSSEDLKKFPDINFQQLKEKRQSLEITVEKITKGSCVPYVISTIKPKP